MQIASLLLTITYSIPVEAVDALACPAKPTLEIVYQILLSPIPQQEASHDEFLHLLRITPEHGTGPPRFLRCPGMVRGPLPSAGRRLVHLHLRTAEQVHTYLRRFLDPEDCLSVYELPVNQVMVGVGVPGCARLASAAPGAAVRAFCGEGVWRCCKGPYRG